ncbi:3,4-dihydroxy-2-butanone 4-phosphate synthase [Bartonella henselae]|uniref:3,4-dihydroxy-2-butanone 4-phosphate synthase n=2 Tax=Bartonella TaxID=773 RepID=X5M6D3_BARHN|nr:3,4-dihydroxy-2-butanone-4-phosphate synthase [Bartonella henselae]MDM9996087.1 3,4-dihydroxy-2-butanone-4-phosphate synthase [Bartonella henselae]OLL48510.1 3,4-dihydroxy-2-butanone 4-phosphate synthase [Bartonella henselae]OLL48838.1 3,4-dihydroxy-2-butanone 4-phosphate synthase [Bartonella henselae]OLL49931.1 3,4-dihydroxy-2-butanone 4-phosphate synthase [Bartonella henselae]OLL57485.1 3,4-dihydroxy-2-butanone 4-phosphate synthase [Bartonella henselae]
MTYDQKKIVSALRAFERGEIVVVTDDDDRENEGDLIVAAVHCTEEKMAFIIRHTTGIVCAPMPKEEAQRFNLTPMVLDNNSVHRTQFTVTVDFKHGTTTGISAHDRTLAVRNLANSNAGANDFIRPGHIFPLIAHEGGVLMRSGHTEAAVDLCKLAGLPPVGVIGELVNDDGSVKHGDEVTRFAQENQFHIITVADLIAYRQRKEMLIQHVGEMHIETLVGPAVVQSYQLPWETVQHVAIIFGDIRDGEDIPVRLHRENIVNDVFGQTSDILEIMRRMMKKEKRGVFVYLREGSVGVKSAVSIQALAMRGGESHTQAIEREEEWRQIGLGSQILKHLGISSVILYASKERHYVGLEGFGIRISRTDIL